jgi:hypothetical protein
MKLLSPLRTCCTAKLRPIRTVVALALIALVLIFSVPFSAAASETTSVEWRQTYNSLQALSIIQTSDGGYAIGGASGSADAATFIKTDSSGNLRWQKAQNTIVSVVQTGDSGYALFCQNYVVKTNADGNFESSFSIGLN